MSLAENIRRLRRDKGWTQGDLADRTGLRVAHISEMEKGKGDPKLSTLYKLMQALECSPDSLLMDTDKVKTDVLLKQALERALSLDEVHKRIALHNLDMYCMAVGMIRETENNQRWLRFYIGPHEPVTATPTAPDMPEPTIPQALPPAPAT
jgi:transcriptional regulator with XRE-family HTH domain